jgi:hypothetical protein
MGTPGRRRLLHGIAAMAAVGIGGRSTWAWAEEGGREAMTRAALAFMAALDPRGQRRAAFPFTHAERLNWHYTPYGTNASARRRVSSTLQARNAST